MKKFISMVLVLVLSVCMVGCGSKKESKIDEIKEKGKIVLGTSATFPPYEYHKEIDGKDEIVGFDIAIAKAIAEDLGVELEIKDMDFGGLLGAMVAGKIDFVVAGMTPTEKRKKNVDFSDVYYVSKQSAVINKKDLEKYKTIEDLKGKSLCVQKGSIQEEIALELSDEKKVKSLGKLANIIMELKNNKVDAVIVENAVANAYVSKNPEMCVANFDIPYDNAGSAIAVNKGNEDLVKVINKVLADLKSENKIEEFVVKYTTLSE